MLFISCHTAVNVAGGVDDFAKAIERTVPDGVPSTIHKRRCLCVSWESLEFALLVSGCK